MENSQELRQIDEVTGIKELVEQGVIIVRENFFGYSENFASEMGRALKNLVLAAIPNGAYLKIIDVRSDLLTSKCLVCKQLARFEIPLQEVVRKFLEEVGSLGAFTPSTKKFLIKMLESEINSERVAYGDDQFIYAVLTKPNIFRRDRPL